VCSLLCAQVPNTIIRMLIMIINKCICPSTE
jgi:hypothetical protein